MLPPRLARFNKVATNRVLRHLVGIGPMAELEHIGRRSGRIHRTMLLAFREGDQVTVALTYGPDVDWLKNLDVGGGGGRLRLGHELLRLGRPHRLTTAQGLAQVPGLVRAVLPVVGVEEFVQLPVVSERRRRRLPRP